MHTSLLLFTNDPDIKVDSKFLGKFQEIIKYSKTSKLFVPCMSQFGTTYQKARRSLKKRIDIKAASIINSNLQDQQVRDPADNPKTSAGDPLEENGLAVDIRLEENELTFASSPKKTSMLSDPAMRNSEKLDIG